MNEQIYLASDLPFWKTIRGKRWIVFIVLVIFGGVLLNIYVSRLEVNEVDLNKVENTLVPESLVKDVAPSIDTVSKEMIKIEVLNGSKVKGRAAITKTLLENGGFVVVSIGNAEKDDYLESVVEVGLDVSEVISSEVVKLLGQKFKTNSEVKVSPDLERGVIRIIVGRD